MQITLATLAVRFSLWVTPTRVTGDYGYDSRSCLP
jgi:hypothetical protein